MDNDPRAESAPVDKAGAAAHPAAVGELIRSRRTMVLATCAHGAPWAAPVYYVYSDPGFYFFSSPVSRHIEQSLSTGTASAAVFADSDRWEQIQGLQMEGTITKVGSRAERLKIAARFLIKFPLARSFIEAGGPRIENAPYVGDRVQLYVFIPESAYYLDNRTGFGKRMPVDFR